MSECGRETLRIDVVQLVPVCNLDTLETFMDPQGDSHIRFIHK